MKQPQVFFLSLFVLLGKFRVSINPLFAGGGGISLETTDGKAHYDMLKDSGLIWLYLMGFVHSEMSCNLSG